MLSTNGRILLGVTGRLVRGFLQDDGILPKIIEADDVTNLIGIHQGQSAGGANFGGTSAPIPTPTPGMESVA